jgi:hypothetical protein
LHVKPHEPRAQTAVPLTAPHTVPHAPQWLVLTWVLVSQPLEAMPSQLAYPVAHTGTHAPATHEVVPLGLMHCAPHAPQLAELLCVLVSQPFCGLPSQLAYPLVHTGAHAPAIQEVVPFGFTQVLPHPPQ